MLCFSAGKFKKLFGLKVVKVLCTLYASKSSLYSISVEVEVYSNFIGNV